MEEVAEKAPSESGDKPRSGCGRTLLFSFAIIALLSLLISFLQDEPELITLRGEAIFSRPAQFGIDPRTCTAKANPILINAVSEGAETINLSSGTKAGAGGCSFSFTVEVPVADRYVFSMPGTSARKYSVKRTLIDVNGPTGVELEVTLRW